MAILRPSSDLITGGWQGSPPGIVTSKQVWRQQPQVPVGINWSNPLTRGILTGISGASEKSIKSESLVVSGAYPARAGSSIGKARKFSTTYSQVAAANVQNKIPNVTLVTITTLHANSNYYLCCSAKYANTGLTITIADSGNTVNARIYNGAGYTDMVGPSSVVNKPKVFAVTHDGTNGTYYVDGEIYSGPTVITYSPPTGGPTPLIVGGNEGIAQSNVLTLIFNRALSAVEVKSLANNPWQIFQKKSNTTYFLPPLYDALDESTYSDTDYISTSTAGDIARVSLGTYTTSAGTHTLKYRACSPEADRGLIARVLELGQPPAIIMKRDIWTSQPQTAVGIDWGNPIAAKLSAVALPINGKILQYSSRKPVEKFGLSSGAGITSQAARLGIGAGISGTFTTDSFRLNATGNVTTSAWEEPVAAATWLTVAIRYGDCVGNAPIFGNQSATTSPNTAWAIYDSSGTGGFTVECSAGGSVRTHMIGSGLLPNHTPMVIVGRYNGAALESFKNGVKQAGSVACSGNFVYPNNADRGAAIGNFYNYTGATRSFNGRVFLSMLFPVALSDAEISSLSANPWQIFKPKSRPIFIDAPKVIASHTKTYTELGTTPAEQTLTLSSGEASSITNGAELALEVESI